MKLQRLTKGAALMLMMIMTGVAMAQGPGGGPGGHGGPGGFPGGPGGPGGRPPMGRPGERPGERPGQMPEDQQTKQVKQKKHVREGSTFKVIGTVRDSVSGENLIYMNVAVLDSVDSAFVKGSTTDADGRFEITDIPAGSYLLRATYIGYQNRLIPFKVSNNTTVGTVLLKPGATMMKEVTVTADRPLYAMDGEKMVYNVADDPSIQTGTTNDALQNAPGVEVDIEGNITLRGVSSVEIWVNDKPSKLTSENLKTYLETLPANALARIETITNPSAKYATESDAVINIVTSAHIKKNHFISFGANGSSSPNVSPWASYMWANERLSVNLYGSFRYSKRDNSGYSNAVTRQDGSVAGTYDTVQCDTNSSMSNNRNYGGNLSLNIDYQIDSMTDFSAWINGNLNGSKSWSGSSSIRDQWTNNLSTLQYQYGDTNDTKSRSFFGMMGADVTHKFDKEGHNIRFGIDGNYSHGWTDQWYTRDYTVYDDLDENKYNKTNTDSYNFGANVRYNKPFNENLELSIGGRFNHDWMHNNYQKLLSNDGGETYTVTDDLRQYEFYGSDDEARADVNLTRRWGGFTAEFGLGGGYDRTKYQYVNMYFPDDSVLSYFTWNPSIHLTYRTESMHNFKLNYSLRQRTPDEEQLTRFKKYGEDSYTVGNPNLKPYTTHSAEVGWTKFFQRFGSVGIDGYARYSANEVDRLTDVTEDADQYLERIISYSTPYNMGSSYRYGATANVTYRPSGFLNIRLYANLYNYGYAMQYHENGHDLDISNNKWSYSFRLNLWTKIFNQYQIHASANYSSPTIGLLSESKARYFLNFGVRSDFFKRKLSVFVDVNDIFNWGKTQGGGSSTSNPYYLSNSNTYTLNSRAIMAGITLRFGKMELERNAKEGMEDGSSTSTTE